MSKTQQQTKNLSFEDALGELEAIVTALERGDVALEDGINRFTRGMALARRCEERLNEAEAKVAVLVQEGGKLVEIDLHSGEPLGEREDPSDEEVPAFMVGRGEDDDEIPF